ncbi:MAG: nucleotide exchange factor GrpE [Myxococcota bacterium]|nr:nucleotide exchange factor GrpE [Myxococcota bacterium]
MSNPTNDGPPIPSASGDESAEEHPESPPYSEPPGPQPGDFALDLSGDLLSEALDAVEKRLYSKKDEPLEEEEFEIEIETSEPTASSEPDSSRPSGVEMKLVARIETLQNELTEAKRKARSAQDEQKLAQMKAKREGNNMGSLKLELQDARDNAASNEKLVGELRGTLKEVNDETRRIKERQKREVNEVQHNTADKICKSVLPVLDNLDRATQHVPDGFEDDQFVQGLLMTLGQLESALNQVGLQRITTELGDAFSPEKHEAIARVSNPDFPPGTIVEVLQEGFSLNGRLLRAARVSVNTTEDAADTAPVEE